MRTEPSLACFDGHSVGLGKFSAGAVKRAQESAHGSAAGFVCAPGRAVDKEIDLLVRRLARSGLLEYRLGHARTMGDQVVIEPQVPDYWPQTPKLGKQDVIVLSRFAYLRRRGNEMVLESPRAGALFRIGDPKIAAALASLVHAAKDQHAAAAATAFPAWSFSRCWWIARSFSRSKLPSGDGLRPSEGDDNLVLWDFHDLLFHTHSTEGRQANPLGGLYPYAGLIPPPPAVRPRWPGKRNRSAQAFGRAVRNTLAVREAPA